MIRLSVVRFCLTVAVAGAALAQYCSSVVASELLVSDRATNRVLAYDASTGAFSRVLVGADASNLFSPAAMTIGFGGDLFVASQGTGKVLRYDIATGAPKGNTPGSPVFADLGIASGPSGLFYDSTNNRLFVGTLGNSDSTVVNILNSTGQNIGSISAGPAGGRAGLAMDASGNLYVNSFNTDGFAPNGGETGAVLKFSGANFSTMSTLIAGDGTYNNSFFNSIPVNVAGMDGMVLGGSSLYTASLFGQEVLKLDAATGAVQAVIGTQFLPNGQQLPPTAYPSGLLFDAVGNLLVTTLGNNNPNDPAYGQFTFPGSVQKFSTSGAFLGVLISGGDSLNEQPGVGFQPTAALLSPVPEPATWFLMISASGGLAIMRRRARKNRAVAAP
jgi:hypothetical protein